MTGRVTRAAVFAAAAGSSVLAIAVVPAGATAQAPTELVMVLTDQTFSVSPGGAWHVVFDVLGDAAVLRAAPTAPTTTTTATTAPGGDAAAGPPVDATAGAVGTVVISAGRPVETRAQLAAVLDGQRPAAADRIEIPLAPVLTSGATTTITLDVPTSDEIGATGALTMRQPGLYPIDVAVVVGDAIVAEHNTFVERLDTDPPTSTATGAGPMNVAIVAATADPGPAADASAIAAGRRDVAAIAALAEAVDGPITVAIPPTLLDGIGSEDPALADALRTTLVGDEVLALPADEMDPSSLAAIDEQATFTRNLVAGEESLAAALPVRPTRESAWMAPEAISTPAATMLRNLGFRSLVLAPEFYEELDGAIGGYFDRTLALEVDLGDGSTLPAKVPDVSGGLLDPAVIDDERSTVDAAVEIAASLVTTRRELGPELDRSAVLMAPDGVVPDAGVASTLARFVSALPDFALAPLSALPAATDTMVVGSSGPVVVTLPDSAGPDLSDRRDPIELARIVCESTGSMIVGDDTQLTAWRRQLDTLLSTGLTDDEFTAGLEQLGTETDAVRANVEMPRPFTFTLTGRSSPLRLNLWNRGLDTLRVVVVPSSPKLRFPEGAKEVDLAPDSVTEVVIPVEARSNGTAPVEIRIVTPEFGQDVGEPIVLTARVNALTGLGQVVTGAAVLVLVSWWYGHFRRRRRTRLAALNGNGASPAAVLSTVSPDAAEVAALRLFDPDDPSGPLPRPGEETAADSLADP